jgi:hypothetical protein
MRLANHESDIKRAIADGDATKIRKAHEAYEASMQAKKQPVKPLDYFKN